MIALDPADVSGLCPCAEVRCHAVSMVRLLGSRSSTRGEFDLEAPGSRFTMHPAFAVRVGHEWMDRSERQADVARRAIAAEFGESWIADDPDIGEVSVLDGVQGEEPPPGFRFSNG